MRSVGFCCVMAMALYAAVAASAVATPQQEHRGAAAAEQPPTILFMCPHGAAKSVLASAYFQRLAKERRLNVRVDSAGTEPDPTVSPAVTAHMTRQGYSIPIAKPRKATPEEVASADVVISIGCDVSGFPTPRGQLRRWDEVPALSEDFARADQKILERVTQLVEELVRKQSKR